MKHVELEVRYGRTINMGGYESLRLDYSSRLQLDDNEDVESMLTGLRLDLRDAVEKAITAEIEWLQGARDMVKKASEGTDSPVRKPSSRRLHR